MTVHPPIFLSLGFVMGNASKPPGSAKPSHTTTLAFSYMKSRNYLQSKKAPATIIPIATGARLAVSLQFQRVPPGNRPRKKEKAKKRSRKSYVAVQAAHIIAAAVHVAFVAHRGTLQNLR
jgi:hypothetical protein